MVLKSDPEPEPDIQFKLFFSDWDGRWGRIKRNCDGWGFCDAHSCFFCCVDANNDYAIVDCETGEPVAQNSIPGTLNPATNEGYFNIELNPSVQIEADAIQNKEVFYIDEDIIADDLLIHKGDYSFDTSIGSYGGYKILVSKI